MSYMCISHFRWFSIFLPYSRSYTCAFLIFQIFEYFSPYSRSYSVRVSFSTCFSFLVIIQGLQCVYLIFHVFECFSTYFPPYGVCFSFSIFFFFFFLVFSPYSRSYSGISHFSRFWILLAYSRSKTVCESFSIIFSFLAILQVLQGAFLIFHVFQDFLPYSRY